MEIALKYNPVPENAPKFAENFSQAMGQVYGITLDYSAESIQALESLLARFEEEQVSSDQAASILFEGGCYLGESLRKRWGGSWQATKGGPYEEVTWFPFVLEFSEGMMCNPIGKMFKRLDNGPEDNVLSFYKVVSLQLEEAMED